MRWGVRSRRASLVRRLVSRIWKSRPATRARRGASSPRGTRVVSAWGIAAVHASLGDVDEAYHWLDVAVREKASGLLLLRVHPRLDPIRGDARYLPLVRAVGLADQ